MSAEKIEKAVKKLVAEIGRANITRRLLAERAQVSEPSVSYHAGGGAAELKKYIIKHSKGVAEPSKEKLAKITETLRNEQKPGPKPKAKKVAKSAVTGKIVSKATKKKPVAKGERKSKPVAKGEAVAKAQAKAVRAPLPPPPAPVAE